MVDIAADQASVWEAVGLLAVGYDIGVVESQLMLSLSAWTLDVPIADVAEYVLWNGITPV